ncbi:aconitate hydratase AcnA [Zavarzinia compransoris]|uniref:Aconitate hydratase n=1 Tax=Zavarzinia compransoris TaxID=1264899 RepID=A0A317DV28_9PROT|nr:aconitate hydratase AcnA [Zavarzinia compransoris]PWR18244.1 aconitate hydratase AcnA [Zavarzinia compransoris]TDP40862.1 aconitate hydratase [Zavarzinia compransoris]
MTSLDTLKARATLRLDGRAYDYFSLGKAAAGLGDLSRLPLSLKVLLENLLRHENGSTVTVEDIRALARWTDSRSSDREIAFRPARVLMQDFSGVPAVVDLAAMRDAMVARGGDPARINPLVPVDLVIDHSVIVDEFAGKDAFAANVRLEYERNAERYEFLRWGQQAFDNFRVVPPGTGICHQVNLEYLSRVAWTRDEDGRTTVYPDTLVGTDSHTTTVNGLGVLGWGVGGIEAEAAMLGQPISMLIPEVVGFRLTGSLGDGVTATDAVLTVTQMLRKLGVVGKFVEFHGPGLDHLSLADRATLANMAPEYGATCGFFPVDAETIDYLRISGRDEAVVRLAEAYAKAQGLWRDDAVTPAFTAELHLDLGTVEPSLAGPRRPQDRVPLSGVADSFARELATGFGKPEGIGPGEIDHGAVVIAAITSCTNTSNPGVMMGAGLLAKKAVAAGLRVKPWVKTSLAPGSQVVTDYLEQAGAAAALEQLGFGLVGYGCTTCIGNSGPLPDKVAEEVAARDLVACAVLSGNRNFEGRVHPQAKANYLASPMLVVAYALAGRITLDLTREPIGQGTAGPVYLADIWPTAREIAEAIGTCVTPEHFRKRYANVFAGDELWRRIAVRPGQTFTWKDQSTYIRRPPYFEGGTAAAPAIDNVIGARILALLGDSITTDHISPAGGIKRDSPAGRFLSDARVAFADFNQYGARRGNHEVMIRGTFANIRIRNEMTPGIEGGVSRYVPDADAPVEPIYDVARRYASEGTPLVVVAGKEYGTGSSRDWAAKGVALLGVKAVIAESFERIHRSNLVGMGVLPLAFQAGTDRKLLGLDGSEVIDLLDLDGPITPRMKVRARFVYRNGAMVEVPLTLRIDTLDELAYFRSGGILHYVLAGLLDKAA